MRKPARKLVSEPIQLLNFFPTKEQRYVQGLPICAFPLADQVEKICY